MKKIVLCFILAFSFTNVFAAYDLTDNVANYVYSTVTEPHVGSVCGEWAVLGLKKSGANIPDEYFEKYYNNLLEFLNANNGVLSSRKNTEYSRVAVTLNALGYNPENVGGYNLITPLTDYDTTVKQGINGAAWALIALDSGMYGDEGIREKYISKILSSQNADGGWSISSGAESDPDVTGMVLQALANYKLRPDVFYALNKALCYVSLIQNNNGGFCSFGVQSSESSAQIVMGLLKLGVDIDSRMFVKCGNSALDNLLLYYNGDGFKHACDGETNQMATEQALLCLAEIKAKNTPVRYFDVRIIMPYERIGI